MKDELSVEFGDSDSGSDWDSSESFEALKLVMIYSLLRQVDGQVQSDVRELDQEWADELKMELASPCPNGTVHKVDSCSGSSLEAWI